MFLLLTFKEFFSLRTALFCISVWGVSLTLRLLWLCRNNPARGCFSRKNGFLRVGALRRWMRAVPSRTQCLFGTSVWGVSLTLRLLWLCRNNPARGCFSRKNGFLRVGALRRRTRRSLLHTVLFWYLYAGWYHYPRRTLHAVETLDARGSRRRIYRFYAVPEFALCGLKIPSLGTHATPAPNRAHSGSHAETRGVFTA